jgi:HSP20 family protein
MLGGLTDFVKELEKLAETGSELTKSGSFQTPGGEEGRKAAKGVYGFSVKLGPGGPSDYKVEPFGNVRRDRETGESVVDEVREPLVDVFDVEDRLLIVAEMPGVEAEDVHVEVAGQTLTLTAERGDRKYRKSVQVPAGVERDGLSVSCRNGIIEISAARPRA